MPRNMDLKIKSRKGCIDENSHYFYINIYLVNADNARLVCISRLWKVALAIKEVLVW